MVVGRFHPTVDGGKKLTVRGLRLHTLANMYDNSDRLKCLNSDDVANPWRCMDISMETAHGYYPWWIYP